MNYRFLIDRKGSRQNNMTDLNSLAANLDLYPERLKIPMRELFSSVSYSNNPLTASLSKIPNGIIQWEQMAYTWKLRIDNDTPGVICDYVGAEPSVPLGKYHAPFDIVLDVDYFVESDVLHPGDKDRQYQVRVQKNPVKYGNGYKYTVVTMGMNEDSIPPKYLTKNWKWNKLASYAGELSDTRGSTHTGGSVEYANKLSKITKSYEISDYANLEYITMGIADGKKIYQYWAPYVEWNFHREWYQERENALWDGKYTENVMQSNNYAVDSGASISQQIREGGWICNTPYLSAEIIEDYLQSIFYGRVLPGRKREVTAFCGEEFMLSFHKAVESKISKSSFFRSVMDMNLAKTIKSEYHENAMEFGYQFVKYMMANGNTVVLKHLPCLDDPKKNFELDATTGRPLSSNQAYFVDLYNDEGGANIQIIEKKGTFAFGYLNGLHKFDGGQKGGSMGHTKSGYSFHQEEVLGAAVLDTSRTGLISCGTPM